MSERFTETHNFPRELNKGTIQDIFYSIDEKIGTKTRFENSRMNAFISKTYEKSVDSVDNVDGVAWAEMSFEAKPYANSEPRYCAVTLNAEVNWKSRKELVSKLSADLGTALEDYFKGN